ncbi:MAG: hypothetical protein PF572_03650 [Patescibacteria group bacterium]|jgi:hypothetical protein|nr:hypothetical protein [Patescibacteria group bacterium]
MKNKKIVLILAVVLISAALYVSLKPESDKVIISDEPRSLEEINEEKGPAPDWLQTLPDYSFNDVEISDDKYSYEYSKETSANGNVARSVEYIKNDENKYAGTIKLSFSSKEETYIETIPKSFASHVDQLNFSIEPSRIINPDPIIEFSNIEGDLKINSKEIIDQEKVKEKIENQIIDTETKQCLKLVGPEKYSCILGIVSKYRDNEYIKKELSTFNMADLLGGASIAVLDKDLGKCKYIKEESTRKTCYEYSYQVLVEECNSKTGKDYRDCVRDTSWQLPNIETRRLFCHHIDDQSMYLECQGKIDMKTCKEIENEDQRLVCQINVAKTGKSIKACEDIESNDGKDLCRAMLGIDKLDKRICDIVKDPYFNGECNLKVAMAKDDKTICQNIKHEDSKDICYSYFALVKNDTEGLNCNNINEEFMRDLCELSQALKEGDANKCESYGGEDHHVNLLCYAAIAVKHNRAELCEKITGAKDEELIPIQNNMKDACYAKIAENTKNEELCQKIINEDVKRACIENLEEPDFPGVSCSDVPAMICPSERKGGGFETIDGVNGAYIRCTYKNPQSNLEIGPLHNEMHRLCLDNEKYCQKWEKHGMYKVYYKSGIIQVATQYTNGKTDGYRINCSETGELTLCDMYDNGKLLGSCMP